MDRFYASAPIELAATQGDEIANKDFGLSTAVRFGLLLEALVMRCFHQFLFGEKA